MRFAPIAIVGQGCLLPGAASSRELTDAVLAGRDLLGVTPPGRWRVDPALVRCSPGAPRRDAAWSDRGGYVEGFERLFDPHGFLLPAAELAGLDPIFLWTIHTAREALRDAGFDGPLPAALRERAALVMGNLSFPTDGLSRLAEATWRQRAGLPAGEPVDPRNRFSSGLPAHLAARALGLDARAFALDAACASSLYAIKLACDQLHDGTIDVAVAGAVNKTDDLFIHVGFCALQALSRTGQSRPFHREADGLVPAEGAGFVVLRRLDDALAAGQRVLGVIRSVGLSNDGRGAGGMLAPAAEGQQRALALAYRDAGLTPADIGLVECHATGTPVGDATELRSMGQLFAGLRDVPIGSLKSNLGHLITVAGVAGLQKMLGALAAETRPPTLHAAHDPLPELASSPFRLVSAPEPWTGPRRAAISAFGFGGNNAHLIVEAPASAPLASVPAALLRPVDLAVVACAVSAADASSTEAFRQAALGHQVHLRHRADGAVSGHADALLLPLAGLRFPPRDLAQTLPQQLAVLQLAREALAAAGDLPLDRTSALIGMGCDPEIARHGGRWRAPDWARSLGADEAWAHAAQDAFVGPLEAAGVLGTMPNIPANRLNSQFGLGGPSFTVASEELSGLEALRLAARSLAAGDIDAALVGASDFSAEIVHESASRALDPATPPAGDAAVVLVLRRLDDARRDGNPVLAVLPADASTSPATVAHPDLHPRLGKAHAATGLVHVAAAVQALAHGVDPADDAPRPRLPSPDARQVTVSTSTALRFSDSVTVRAEGPARPLLLAPPPRIHLFTGADRTAVAEALAAGREGGDGPCRLALVATDESEWHRQREALLPQLLSDSPLPLSPVAGAFFRERPVGGQLAFVFGGPGSVYQGMGRSLVLALPELLERLSRRFVRVRETVGWIYEPGDVAARGPNDKLWAASFLMQTHAELSQRTLGLRPDAVIGISSGETNALFAAGAWTDLDAMYADIAASGLYDRELAGEFRAARRAWNLPDDEPVRWANFRVLAPVAQVREALATEPRAHLTIIHAPHDVVIGGDADACQRVLARIGPERARPLGYDLVVHSDEMHEWRDAWWNLHHRPTTPVPGVRFYSHAHGGSYEPSDEAVAGALLGQALRTVDFPALVRRAYDDGVRVFLEHGPHGACCRWIESSLGERDDYLAIPLDLHGEDALTQAVHATAALLVAGVAVDHAALTGRLAAAWSASHRPAPSAHTLSFPAHRPPPDLPPLPTAAGAVTLSTSSSSPQIMAPAPVLPSVLDEAPASAPVASSPVASPVLAPAAAPARPAMPPEAAPARPAAPPVATPAAPARPVTPTAARPAAPVAARPVAPSVSSGTSLQRPSAPHAARALSRPGALPAVAALQQQVAAIHGQFLAQQASLHQRFLGLRANEPFAALPAAATAPTVTAPVAPAAPVAARAPVAPAAPVMGRGPIAPDVPPPVPLPVSAPSFTPAPAPRPAAPAPVLTPPVPVAPVATVTAVARPARPAPRGPAYSRHDLEILASDRISRVFGPLFERQDGFARQVRMPMPPLLLADRVTGIDAEPGSMKTGTIWTETDVAWDAWYVHEGHMAPGIMIEAGQADLLLISWLGADFLNKGERIYRLLGCDLRYHGRLPKPGETLRYDIHVDGHAKHEDVRLFFFHYDCHIGDERRLSVRGGQAGFFTDAELLASGGILWDAATGENTPNARLDAPRCPEVPQSYTREQLDALADGRPWDCFGDSHRRARTHVRTPRTGAGPLQLFDAVTHLDPKGGPWGRGYLRAVQTITPDDWFFQGHFKGDPCMPGTLMFEGSMQTMAFYLLAMGYSLDADGWTFEPVPEETYKLRCRGQVTPTSRELVYELFVDEIVAGPVPTLYADLLCTVDGLKAFHCRRMGFRLAPDWPMDRMRELAEMPSDTSHEVASHDGFRFDYRSLMACAWGRPSEAFGAMYRVFDGPRRTPRLPGPPYHFVSRIARIDGPINVDKAGTIVAADYDVPPDAWYFDENGSPTMPSAVVMETTLQPCGWLASAMGVTLRSDTDLCFRNLDGTATWHVEVLPDTGTLRTTTKLTTMAKSAGMVIVNFDVACRQGDTLVYEMKTVFGFFPPEALASQAGISVGDDERAWLVKESDLRIDLKARPERFFERGARLASGKLLMIDRLTGHWPTAGKAGLGRMRAEKDIDPGEWFFKAHFYQDPVQPGSLGIEAMIQVLQAAMLQHDLDAGMKSPRFEPLALGLPLTWKYRGQVVPENKLVTSEIEFTSITRGDGSVTAIAEAWLWVDGMCIYHAKNMGMRIVDDGDQPRPPRPRKAEAPAPARLPSDSRRAPVGHHAALSLPAASAPRVTGDGDDTLSLARSPWIGDHRPTHTVPALPAMYMIDRLAGAAQQAAGQPVVEVREALIRRWAPVNGELRTRASAAASDGGHDAVFEIFRDAPQASLSRFETAAQGRVLTGSYPEAPDALAPLTDAAPVDDPYASGALFHGPSLQLLAELRRGPGGASAVLDLDRAKGGPQGSLNVSLLDAATHAIPHDELGVWFADIDPETVAYPAVVRSLRLFGPAPTSGRVQLEVRPDGLDDGGRFPRFRLQLQQDGRVWAEMVLVEALFPRGRLGALPPAERRSFLRRERAVADASLGRFDGEATRLTAAEVAASNWLPGTIESVYGASGQTGDDLVARVAVQEHLARQLGEHPSAIEVDLAAGTARCPRRPFEKLSYSLSREGDEVVVRSPEPARLDTAGARAWWARELGRDTPAVADLYLGLAERFVASITIEAPGALAAFKGKSIVLLANHQVMVESPLFSMMLSSLIDSVVVTVAKVEHRTSWLGKLITHSFQSPGVTDPVNIVYFDRADKASLLGLAVELQQAMTEKHRSLLVHVEGTRALAAGAPVEKISSVWSDVAMATGAPVVPVRFLDALPVSTDERLDFPVGYGKQRIVVGAPITAEELAALPLADRKRRILDALNAPAAGDTPTAPDPDFAAAVDQWRRRTGVNEPQAVLLLALEQRVGAAPETRELVRAIHAGRLDQLPDTDEGQWLRGLARQLA